MDLRIRLLRIADRATAALIVAVLCGTALAFGGLVWWMKPALAVAATLLALAWLIRSLLIGRWIMLRSPLGAIGLLAMGLGLLQLVPFPGRVAGAISPRSRAIHALGTIPDLARADDPAVELPEPVADRTPATLDRPATLRWVAGAAACLVVFCASGQFADRFGHAAIVWGSIVAVFFAGTTFGAAQMLGKTSGLYGAIEPGAGRPGLPTTDDLASAPGSSALRPVGPNTEATPWALPRPDRPFLFGPMLGGPGAYLAIGSLGLPLSLGLLLQLLAPRGSRESLRSRIRESGRGGLVALLLLTAGVGAALIGFLAQGPLLVPFVVGVIVVGLPGAWSSGLRWGSVGLTAATLGAMAAGVVVAGRSEGDRALETSPVESAQVAARMLRDYPLVGAGMGTYPTLASYAKTRDELRNTAGGSVFAWCAESGFAGVALFGLAGLWCVLKLPGAIRRVGSADRTLAFMMAGTMACFALFSAVHWTTELIAVALAACALLGTANRWLAGGTDLFVEAA